MPSLTKRMSDIAIVAAIAALLATTPASARSLRLDNTILRGAVSLACALDYSNANETRMIITNTSGGTLSQGRRVVWAAGDERGAFFLGADFPAGQVRSFGLNAKGYECTVKVERQQYVLAP